MKLKNSWTPDWLKEFSNWPTALYHLEHAFGDRDATALVVDETDDLVGEFHKFFGIIRLFNSATELAEKHTIKLNHADVSRSCAKLVISGSCCNHIK